MNTVPIQDRVKPSSAEELVNILTIEAGEFGKGARRLANFFVTNPSDTALLTSAELAKRCGVHASSVVRLAQSLGFSGYKELQLLFRKNLSGSIANLNAIYDGGIPNSKTGNVLEIQLLGESGKSFNEAAMTAAARYQEIDSTVAIKTDFHLPHEIDPRIFAEQIKNAAISAAGIILIAREHPAINNAVRAVVAKGIPVICLTTDLPSSPRTAYVGSDQYASGATAGHLCGRMLPRNKTGKVLFVYSVPFRCQLDREQGFRQILRTDFPSLSIDEKVGSNESIEIIYEAIRRYISKFGAPAAIYNVSGGNTGIGRALEDEGISTSTIFIGHELNDHSRALLERGTMDFAIGHDFNSEIASAVRCIRMALNGQQPVKKLTQSQLFTRYNCTVF